jgi:hypothetical protein
MADHQPSEIVGGTKLNKKAKISVIIKHTLGA